VKRGRYFRGPRTRRREGEGWRVRARVERFGEPALLPELLPEERIDMGNLYRVLRALEDQGVVRSEWDADAPGPAKRIYELTDEGRALLDSWAESLRTTRENVGAFLARYEDGRR
jgi:PadR family transcriptional regulator, regulatory protein PadR